MLGFAKMLVDLQHAQIMKRKFRFSDKNQNMSIPKLFLTVKKIPNWTELIKNQIAPFVQFDLCLHSPKMAKESRIDAEKLIF